MLRFTLIALGSIAIVISGCATGGGGTGKSGDALTSSETASGGACVNKAKDPGETDIDCGGACAPCAEGKGCAEAKDCASAVCGTGYVCLSATCGNGKKDGKETGIDCGGSCPLCPGDKCSKNEQCTTGYCKTGVCDTPSCTDGVKNGKETGTDCGGDECPLCDDGQGCVNAKSCKSGFCNKDGKCASASCTDLEKNGKETDVDCGGGCPDACAEGKDCAVPEDCKTAKCSGGKCVALGGGCANGKLDGDETDIDCGGGCGGCGFGKVCKAEADCKSKLCTGGKCEAPASCGDAKQTPGETDVDCGGVDCPACGLTKSCKAHTDCLSIACILGQCKEPACDDKVKNGDETDEDCGGKCALKCADGKQCKAGTDCEGGNCEGGYCGSCTDKKLNGAESDVDCGGVCSTKCGDGLKCKDALDCANSRCDSGVCGSCTDKKLNGPETDTDCGGGGCDPCGLNKKCVKAGDCESGGCEGGLCCTTNACGVCGVVPKEVCNGKDDDCNSETDEGAAATGSCANQKGVCAGTTGKCLGAAGYQCTESDYATQAKGFEAVETACDKLDNDCNGTTDETGCSACSGTLKTTTVDASSPQALWVAQRFFSVINGVPTAYVSYETPAASSRAGVYITPTTPQAFDSKVMNGPAVAKAGGTTYLVYRHDVGTSSHDVEIGKAAPSFDPIETFNNEAAAGSHATPVAVNGSTIAYLFVVPGYGMKLRISKGLAPNSAWDVKFVDNVTFDSGADLAVTSKGKVITVWRANNEAGALQFTSNSYGQAGSGSPDTIDSGVGHGAPSLAIDAKDVIHLAYWNGKDIVYRAYEGSDWSEATTVTTIGLVAKNKVFTAVGPTGRVFVQWVTEGGKVEIARKDASGFTKVGAWSVTKKATESITRSNMEVGTGDVFTIGSYVDSIDGDYISFLTTCAGYTGATTCTKQCTNKECGDDGCGGDCGPCGADKTCNAGKCTGGTTTAGCGADFPDCKACVCKQDSYCCTGWDGQCTKECTSFTACNEACGIAACVKNCTNKKCGDDGCGGSCGSCDTGFTCSTGGQCEVASGTDKFGLPTGCLKQVATSTCNPVSNAECKSTPGAACDVQGDGATGCFPPPNDAAKGAACSNDAGPFCQGGLHCDTASKTCRSFCCSTKDCGGKACTAIDTTNFGAIGVCAP